MPDWIEPRKGRRGVPGRSETKTGPRTHLRNVRGAAINTHDEDCIRGPRAPRAGGWGVVGGWDREGRGEGTGEGGVGWCRRGEGRRGWVGEREREGGGKRIWGERGEGVEGGFASA